MKTKIRLISFLLVFLITSTNMVMSIESIYCFCFKTTKYSFAISEKDCCNHQYKKACDVKDCCKLSLKKMPCNTKSTISINSKAEFISLIKTLKYFSVCIIQDKTILNSTSSNKTDVICRFYSDTSPPDYLISLPFLQSFLC